MAIVSSQRRELQEAEQPRHHKAPKQVVLQFHLLFLVFFFGILGVSILYLAQFNELATQGVIIDGLERRRAQLLVENEVWRMKISQLKSLDVIQQQGVLRTLENVNEVEYVE